MLTIEQNKAIDFIQTNYNNNIHNKFVILKGCAGTGKTTVISEYCNKSKHKIIVTAPTHKAVKVLDDKVSVDCKTIHSYLGLRRQLEGNQYVYKPDKYFVPEYADMLIIDEVSMLDSKLLDTISNHINAKFVLFVGDEKQINPVGESISPSFKLDIPTFTLSKIIRQDNDIIDLSQNLDWIDKRKEGANFSWTTIRNSLDYLVESNGTDKCKYITWTNDDVNYINTVVRKKIYSTPSQFHEGEVILLKSQYKDLYMNNQEVIINNISDDIFEYSKIQLPHPIIKTFVINYNMICINKEDEFKYNENIKFLLDRVAPFYMKWADYYEYVETFADYQYNHAITVHKSQGSTYEKAVINTNNISFNPDSKEVKKLLYTAVTRAKYHNYLI